MQFPGGQTIITPRESPHYQLDWRHALARIWVAHPDYDMPLEYMADPWIEAQVAYLQAQVHQRFVSMYEQSRPTDVQLANDIHQQLGGDQLVHRLQAMLLTEAPLEVVSKDLGLRTDVVRYYERVFYGCRDRTGARPGSGEQLLHFAYQGATRVVGYGAARDHITWRVLAVTMGYTGIAYHWALPEPAGELLSTREMVEKCFDTGVGQMIAKYAGGQVQLIDIQQMFGHYISYEKFHREGEQGHNQAAQALWQLIRALAPSLSEFANVQSLAAAEKERDLLGELSESTAQAQARISGQDVDEQEVDINELLDNQIRAKMETVRPSKATEAERRKAREREKLDPELDPE